jgi:bifunctional DNA-binding transcriptional regulator/antitoxin component of YhaV-PrlF toxin-antitoxin module
MSEPRSATFDTTLTATGSNTGIVVPEEVLERLGAGKRPPLLVELNGHGYRTTAGVLGGRSTVPVSAAVRKATGLAAGDQVRVTLTVAGTPREVRVPDDLAAALAADAQAGAFFAGLSNSLQRYHVDAVTGARTPETRQRRVEKALALFRAGRQR